MHTQIIDHPVVNLSVDGESAKGRWYGFFLLSDSQGNASIQGGVFENEYVREDGKWKIGVHRISTRNMPAPMKPAGPTGRGGSRHPSLSFHAG